jgi:hypothetical protein
VANATQPDNSHCTRCEKANSNFDNRHRFVVTANYALPNSVRVASATRQGLAAKHDRDDQRRQSISPDAV